MLELDGVPAAMEFAFRIDGVCHPLWVALDTKFKDYSPGAVLKALIIRSLIHDGVRAYDFMQGGESYKLRWGTEERKYVNLSAARPFSRAALHCSIDTLQIRRRRFTARQITRAKAAARSLLPERVVDALKARLTSNQKVANGRN